jgi:hypothetical protein
MGVSEYDRLDVVCTPEHVKTRGREQIGMVEASLNAQLRIRRTPVIHLVQEKRASGQDGDGDPACDSRIVLLVLEPYHHLQQLNDPIFLLRHDRLEEGGLRNGLIDARMILTLLWQAAGDCLYWPQIYSIRYEKTFFNTQSDCTAGNCLIWIHEVDDKMTIHPTLKMISLDFQSEII